MEMREVFSPLPLFQRAGICKACKLKDKCPLSGIFRRRRVVKKGDRDAH